MSVNNWAAVEIKVLGHTKRTVENYGILKKIFSPNSVSGKVNSSTQRWVIVGKKQNKTKRNGKKRKQW